MEEDGIIKAYFCVSNDSIRKKDSTNSGIMDVLKNIPSEKRYSSLPAVKIGRLATSKEYQRNGIGTQVLDIIKAIFTTKNKTGCRFIIVDALNNDETIKFYERNGFQILKPREKNDKSATVLMFFDLITFRI